jgi:hypothetical protein
MTSSRLEWIDSGYIIRVGTGLRQVTQTAFRRSLPSPGAASLDFLRSMEGYYRYLTAW